MLNNGFSSVSEIEKQTLGSSKIEQREALRAVLNAYIDQLQEEGSLLGQRNKTAAREALRKNVLFGELQTLKDQCNQLQASLETRNAENEIFQGILKDSTAAIRSQAEEIANLKAYIEQKRTAQQKTVPKEWQTKEYLFSVQKFNDDARQLQLELDTLEAEVKRKQQLILQGNQVKKQNKGQRSVDRFKYFEALEYAHVLVRLLGQLLLNDGKELQLFQTFLNTDQNIMEFRRRVQLMQELLTAASGADNNMVEMLVADQLELAKTAYKQALDDDDCAPSAMNRIAHMVLTELQ